VWEGLVEDAVDECRRHAPGLVQVVKREEGAIGQDIAASEDAAHARHQPLTKDELLGNRGQRGNRDEQLEAGDSRGGYVRVASDTVKMSECHYG
jgi:hypothetical protein